MKTTILAAALIGFATQVFAQAIDDAYSKMSALVAAGICFHNMPEYDTVLYTEYCGADYLNIMSLSEVNECQQKVDRYNNERVSYNQFKRECMRNGSANQRTPNVPAGGAAGNEEGATSNPNVTAFLSKNNCSGHGNCDGQTNAAYGKVTPEMHTPLV
jgi:hypothetical protein